MKVTDAIDAATSTYLSKPTSILPFYLLGSSVGLVARVFPLLGAFAAYLILEAQGRMDRVREAVAALDPEVVEELEAAEEDPTTTATDPEALPTGELEGIAEALASPEALLVLGLSVLVGVLVYVVLAAAVRAGEIHTVYAGLEGRPPVHAGVSGFLRDALSFVGLRLIEIALYLTVTAFYGIVLLVAVLSGAEGGLGLLAVGLAVLLTPIWLVSLVAIAAVFVFAPQAIVVDRVGAIDGFRHGAGFVRRRPGAFAVYVLIAIGLLVAAGITASLLAVFDLGQVATLLGIVLFTPFVDLLKTGIYAEGDRIGGKRLQERETIRTRTHAAFSRGWSTLWSFTRGSPKALAASLGLFGLGMAGGYLALGGVTIETTPPSDPTEIFGVFPLDVFIAIAVNNWLVGVDTAFAGFAFGVPTAVNLLFNGIVVGLVAGVSADLLLVAALIVPHALIELPAIAIAGALGFHLAGVGWNRVRGRVDDRHLAVEIDRAFWVLVGLSILFVIASFVEAFVTPRIGGLFF
ncbi:stage II sporulation protein M [Natronorarus salvus]|uniref:stage II sporulation protein M n=1 Tax=Natronorarus salvus TaxID=3117733 RepID=UPI002F26DEC0